MFEEVPENTVRKVKYAERFPLKSNNDTIIFFISRLLETTKSDDR
jgi:hypothetical protein